MKILYIGERNASLTAQMEEITALRVEHLKDAAAQLIPQDDSMTIAPKPVSIEARLNEMAFHGSLECPVCRDLVDLLVDLYSLRTPTIICGW